MRIVDTNLLVDVLRDDGPAVAWLLALPDNLDLSDALIAATTLELRATLLTRNVKHFAYIPALAIEAPYS